MPITSTCNGCGKTLAVADEYAGRQARCPECGTIYTVPTPTPIQPIAPLAPLDLTGPYGPQSSAPQTAVPQPAVPQPGTQQPGALPTFSTSAASASGSAGAASSANDPFAEPLTPVATDRKYWMRATNGAEYGPADAATLARWFAEGRVGQNYQIREGEMGVWQPAAYYQPSGTSTASAPSNSNPYATQPNQAVGPTGYRRYPKSDQSGLVLAMGILAWLGFCPIFGVIGWVVGAQAIADIRAGHSDPATLGVTQWGYYLSMINVVCAVACTSLSFLFIALAAIG